MRNKKKLLIGLFCVIIGFSGVMAYQGYSASIQAGTKKAKKQKKTKKKPSPTYAPLRDATMVVKSRVYVKKINNANREIAKTKKSLKKSQNKIKALKKHRQEAKRIMSKGSDETGDDLINYTKKYNSFEYKNNVGYSMYQDLQDDYATKEETALGSTLQSMALSIGNVAVSDMLKEDVENVTTEIELMRDAAKEQRKKLRAIRKKKKKVVQYVNIIFDSKNIFLPSNVDKKSLNYALAGTGMESLAGAFLAAEEEYGVNAVALAGIAAHESAWGNSKRARVDNNLTGFGVYSSSSRGINGRTKTDNILATARCLATRYAEPGQPYFHGSGLLGVNKSYAASTTWASRVEDCSITIMKKIADYNRRDRYGSLHDQ